MSPELKELIDRQISYYRQHTVKGMIEKRPEFVIEDYEELLSALEKELTDEMLIPA